MVFSNPGAEGCFRFETEFLLCTGALQASSRLPVGVGAIPAHKALEPGQLDEILDRDL